LIDDITTKQPCAKAGTDRDERFGREQVHCENDEDEAAAAAAARKNRSGYIDDKDEELQVQNQRSCCVFGLATIDRRESKPRKRERRKEAVAYNRNGVGTLVLFHG
jgi:hypothetical protein